MHWSGLLTLTALISNATLILANLSLVMRLRKGPPRSKRRFAEVKGGENFPHRVPQFAVALMRQLLRDIEVHFQITHHQLWDQVRDPEVPEIIYQPYAEGQEGTKHANLETVEVRLQWQMAPGQHCYADRELTVEEWARWYETNLLRIVSARNLAA